MKAIFDPVQTQHDPQNFLVMGTKRSSPEQPERVTRLRAGAEAAGCTFEAPGDAGLGPIAAIHTPEYVAFLQTIHARWQDLPGAAPEVIPNIHARARNDSYPTSPVGQAGYHQGDTACPIGAQTWGSAYASAQTAISGADAVADGARAVYALSRPPGHHAYADMASGFCFLNNSAIAAERLRSKGLRPAIFDVDVHHGNGTQDIFYARNDVLTVSIHADPTGFTRFSGATRQSAEWAPGWATTSTWPCRWAAATRRFWRRWARPRHVSPISAPMFWWWRWALMRMKVILSRRWP